MSDLIPIQIRNRQHQRLLEIHWDDGAEQHFAHTLLRRVCRCADCVAARRGANDSTSINADVSLIELVPVGQYGLQLRFSDGHERGIYPWRMLRELADDDDALSS